MNRYTYVVFDEAGFELVLNFWANQNRHYPIFVNQHGQVGGEFSATYYFETELYRASITVYRQTQSEIDTVFKKLQNKHLFIGISACEEEFQSESS